MQMNFIHIGYHKTASTWLQKAIFPQVPGLLICNDAKLGLERDFFDPFILADPFRFEREAFLRGFSAAVSSKVGDLAQYSVIGISEENLSGDVLNGKDARMLADRIVDVFGPTRILIVIRNQIDMLLSVYSNYVIHGGTASLQHLLNDLNLEGMRVYNKLKFSGLVDYYRGLHGAENVHVECFERLTREPNPLHGFFERLGVTMGKLQRAASENRGRTLLGNALLRVSNRTSFGQRYIAKIPLPDQRDRDREYVRALIPTAIAAWQEDNARLAETLGLTLPPAYALSSAQ